ncbi:2Fe-2S iron-sulfur cluster-binding protein [Duganella callida]|uniref:2Fe-2S iron-sulfur cluster binding domain-containing protein n=1 Tax=Duganella callida TaxID=2561932 RepID=A0A4Y9SHQ1_9BURK|nr:pyridoxamine 5'-phosphate oxidase family protein [Duganella callida]TFW23737.1 2Fe-2S iron-sulfur cluster binding domain-containing protein [Duganella callida]
MGSAPSPFHAQELAVQERVGVREQMAGAAPFIRDHMPDQHRQFYSELPFFFLGALDASGQPWATLLAGAPGFVSSPDPRTLHIAGGLLRGDPLQDQLHVGGHIGGLGLAPTTRRRNRVNGEIVAAGEGGFSIAVRQSFGNCPQYIQHRQHSAAPTDGQPVQVQRGVELSAADRELIARADTYFIASANLHSDAGFGRGVDMSHRGGRPGFVRVDDERSLTAPEFVGNFFFNTIGNLMTEPRAGLLFIDFERGDLLHLAVEAEVIWDGDQVRAFAGAERLLRFHVREVVRNVGALPFRWTAPQPAAQLARTGNWEEADRVQAAASLTRNWRPFKVMDAVAESADVRSFYLQPADGQGVAAHQPGQFISVRAAGQIRSYTVSDAPNGRWYRISVKRDGAVSTWLHAHLTPGAQIELMGPGGDFIFDAGTQRPVVMLSAGIGITPMIAMLNGLLVNGSRTRHKHAIHFIHAARSADEMPFHQHLQTLAAGHGNLHLHLQHSSTQGRLTIDTVKRLLPFDDYDFYLCGPDGFMQAMHDGLRKLNIADQRIRFETFGRGQSRHSDTSAAVAAELVPVHFAQSGVEVMWDGTQSSLLELAEAHGLEAAAGCRSGLCGSCAVGLKGGEVAYTRSCGAQPEAGQVLLCSVRPRAGSGTVTLAL